MFFVLVVCSFFSAVVLENRVGLSTGSDIQIWAPNNVSLYSTSVDIRNDKGFIYLMCDDDEERPEKRFSLDVKCTLHLVTPTGRKQECELHYEDSGSGHFISFRPFGEERILFSTFETGKEKLVSHHPRIIDWSDCSSHKIAISTITLGQWERLVVYPNEFHLLLHGDKMCGNLEHCKIKFNQRGEMIGEVVANPLVYDFFSEIRTPPESQANGSFTYGTLKPNYPDGRAIYTYANGTQKVLASWQHKALYQMGSYDHDLYAFCRTTGKFRKYGWEFWCMQYDWRTGESMNFTFDGYPEKRNESTQFYIRSVFNLDKGKFLFATIECGKIVCDKLHLSTVNSSGQIEKSTAFPMNLKSLEEFLWLDSATSHSDDEFCFNFSSSNFLTDTVDDNRFVSFYNKCIPRSWI
ncbi:hypothetical protein QAD02_016874 [Eretmocerus hayati]|uniref:Uncharacterized protein n=1 Tax=Eretmocerus hayati TaxID=131215 RepID=A0ACC2PF67_9HYME|nr:hypothetical protein QAD02_016874 [Eretmocerus hayati]